MRNFGYTQDELADLAKKFRLSRFSLNLLIYGKPGSGKTFLSNRIALSISGSKNFIEISPIEDSISIDQVRELNKNLQLTCLNSFAKVAVINDAEKLTKQASNALLKTLEDHFSSTIILLNTSNIYNVSSTLKSRCFIMPLRCIEVKKFIDILSYRTKAETKELELAYELFTGDINKANYFFNMRKFCGLNLTNSSVKEILLFMDMLDLGNVMEYRIFLCFYDQLIVLLVKNMKNVNIALLNVLDQFEDLLHNIGNLNPSYVKSSVINYLKKCS